MPLCVFSNLSYYLFCFCIRMPIITNIMKPNVIATIQIPESIAIMPVRIGLGSDLKERTTRSNGNRATMKPHRADTII